ncbi:hypothetical protein [Teichococcus aestuarii]
MSRKHESIASQNLFYAFVDFGADLSALPMCFIVPSTIVATVIASTHQAWLAAPGKSGQQRTDTDFRRFLPDYDRVDPGLGYSKGWLEPYREKWSLIEEQGDMA